MLKTRKHKNMKKDIKVHTLAKGWSKQAPNTRQRTKMIKKCGKKCFLGPKTTFPICTKNTCKVNKKGVYAAYVRAREYSTIKGTKKYKQIVKKAYNMLS